jgi:hypothetical protein
VVVHARAQRDTDLVVLARHVRLVDARAKVLLELRRPRACAVAAMPVHVFPARPVQRDLAASAATP